MKRKFTFLILILIFSKIYSQDSINQEANKLNNKADEKNIIGIEKADSQTDSSSPQKRNEYDLIIPKGDSIHLDTESINKNFTILFKETKSIDYFKYIFPFLTLILGIVINQLIDYFSNKKKIRKEGLRWVIELENLNKPIDSQIKNIEEFLENYNEDNFEIPTLKINPYLEADSFKHLDQTFLLKYLEKEKDKKYDSAIEQVNEINAFLTEIRFNHNTLQTKFKEFLTQTSVYVTALNENLQTLLKDIAYYEMLLQEEIERDPSNDARFRPILNLINTQIIPHMHDGSFNPFNLEINFYKPLMEILVPNRFDARTKDMIESVRNGINSIKGIKMERIYLIENLEKIKSNFESNRDELPNLNRLMR